LVCDHDVVVVPVADAEHVRGHAVAGARLHEALHGPVMLRGTRPQSLMVMCSNQRRASTLHGSLDEKMGHQGHGAAPLDEATPPSCSSS